MYHVELHCIGTAFTFFSSFKVALYWLQQEKQYLLEGSDFHANSCIPMGNAQINLRHNSIWDDTMQNKRVLALLSPNKMHLTEKLLYNCHQMLSGGGGVCVHPTSVFKWGFGGRSSVTELLVLHVLTQPKIFFTSWMQLQKDSAAILQPFFYPLCILAAASGGSIFKKYPRF